MAAVIALTVVLFLLALGVCLWLCAGALDRREAERERIAELETREQRERAERRARLGLPERADWDW